MWSPTWTFVALGVYGTCTTCHPSFREFTRNHGVIQKAVGVVHLSIHRVIHNSEFNLKDDLGKTCGNLWIAVDDVDGE